MRWFRKQLPGGGGRKSASAWVHLLGGAVWSRRDYRRFAEEGYIRNVVAHRCVQLVAEATGSLKIFTTSRSGKRPAGSHPMLELLDGGPLGRNLLHDIAASLLIGGNAYVLILTPADDRPPEELHLLRADRMRVVPGKHAVPAGYALKTEGKEETFWPANPVTGESRVLHVKRYHPLDDWHGLSPMEAAAFAVDLHNQASAWNQSLLQNGARPSGALVVEPDEHNGGHLTEEQYQRLRAQLDGLYAGAANSGRPMILEGGLNWRPMSITPQEMDFLNAKHAAARDIALAFGVPPQLLGIPGDNTYSNLAEARLALWEQTVLPLACDILKRLEQRLSPLYPDKPSLHFDLEAVTALTPRRDALWKRISEADFLQDHEKRAALGLEPTARDA